MELDEIHESQPAGKKKNSYLIPVVSIVVTLGFCLSLFKYFHWSSAQTQKVETNYAPYVDFAENFVVAFNNINYVNQDQQRASIADMMDSDLLTSYQNSFYDPNFLKLVQDNKILVTFQKISRSELVTTAANEAAVKVIGFDLFHSDLTGAQKEKPFTYLVDVKMIGDSKYHIMKVQKL